MNRAYRPGIALIGTVALGGLAWPAVTAGQGVFGPGGSAAAVAISLMAIGLMTHPLSRSRPAILGLAALMAMTPYASFLIGCVVMSSVPEGYAPALPRSTVSLIALIASFAALIGFLLSLVRVLRIRSGALVKTPTPGL